MPARRRKRPENHVAQRVRERYNTVVTRMDFDDIQKQIVQGRARLVEDQILKAVYEVEFHGKPAIVVYDLRTRRVVTFLSKKHAQFLQAEAGT